MAEYIDRDALGARLKELYEKGNISLDDEILYEIFEAPTIDVVPLEDYRSMERTVNKLTEALAEVVPVVHGHWVIEPDATVMHCNACGWAFEYYGGLEEEWNNCPHCGAKMDEEEE